MNVCVYVVNTVLLDFARFKNLKKSYKCFARLYLYISEKQNLQTYKSCMAIHEI